MKLQMFSVFDIKARAYITPFFLPNREVAIRSFGECANIATHSFARSPTDYFLYHVGEFDDAGTGVFFSEPINLGSAAIHQTVQFDFNVKTIQEGSGHE